MGIYDPFLKTVRQAKAQYGRETFGCMNQVMCVAVQDHLTEITLFPSLCVVIKYVVGLLFKLSFKNREFGPEKQVSQ